MQYRPSTSVIKRQGSNFNTCRLNSIAVEKVRNSDYAINDSKTSPNNGVCLHQILVIQCFFYPLPETPSVLTVATPDTTTPARPKEDGWTATGGGSPPPKLEVG